MNDKERRFTGEDIRVIAVSAAIVSVVGFMAVSLWLATQGHMIAAVALTALLFGSGFLVAQRATVSNNSRDNAQIIEAIMRAQRGPRLPEEMEEVYRQLRERARVEEQLHRTERASLAARAASPVRPGESPIEDAPWLRTDDATFDVD